MEAPGTPEQASPAALRPGGIGACTLRGPSLAVVSAGHASSADAQALPFKLLLVQEGRSHVSQAGRRAELGAGEFTLLDGAQPLRVDAAGPYAHVVVALPRTAVTARHRGVEYRTARVHGARTGDALVRDFALSWADGAARLGAFETSHAAAALVQLLGLLHEPRAFDAAASLRQRALALIDLHIAQANASAIAAQLRVTRRTLDAAFAVTGRSFGAHLLERRLLRAAQRLHEAGADSISQIAEEVGFCDASHFSKAFRSRFQTTPSRWRRGPAA